MATIEAVSLDAYGTLIAGGSDAFITLMHDVAPTARTAVTAPALLAHRERLIGELEQRPFMRMRERDTWILSELYGAYGIDRDAAADAAALGARYLDVTLYGDAAPLLQALQATGLPLVVVSNADDDMMAQVLARVGVTDAFRAVVTSEKARAYKPAPAIFETAVTALGVAPERILHVGDSFIADVVGAKRAGLRAAWLTRDGGLPPPETRPAEPDAVIADLSGVLPLLSA